MKFEFPEESMVNEKLNLDALTQVIYGKNFDYINNFINIIKVYAILNEKTTHLMPGNEIKELYVIKIFLKRPGLPLELLKRLDAYINFPVLYWLNYKDFNNFILPVFSENREKKQKPLRIFYTGWDEMDKSLCKYSLCSKHDTSLDDVYKRLMMFMCGLKVNYNNITIAEYIEFLKYEIDCLREFREGINAFDSAFQVFDVKIGSPTFDSMKELFFIAHDKGPNYQAEPFSKITFYIAQLGYEQYNLKLVGTRRYDYGLFETLYVLENIKIGLTNIGIRYELNAKVGTKDLASQQGNNRLRSDDEISEMKLLYGKYLIENGYDANSDDEDNVLTKKRLKNLVRRKMTAEERKKYLGE